MGGRGVVSADIAALTGRGAMRLVHEFVLLDCGQVRLQSDEDAFTMTWDQTCDDFLSHVLGRIVEQLLQLVAGELVDDLVFAPDRLWVLSVKEMHFLLFLVVIFDQATSAVNHFVEAVRKPFADLGLLAPACALVQILRVRLLPDVVRDKLLETLQLVLQTGIGLQLVKRVDDAGDVLDEDVVACDHDLGAGLFRGLLRIRRRNARAVCH